MGRSASRKSTFRKVLAGASALGIVFAASTKLKADEGGVGLWVPGFFGSLSATPMEPGFSYAGVYYHGFVKAGGDVAFARQVNRGNIAVNFTGGLNANIEGVADIYFGTLSYTFAQSFLGGQPNIALAVPYGRSR